MPDIIEGLVADDSQEAQMFLAAIARSHPLATERGYAAMVSAAGAKPEIIRDLSRLENEHERALWLLTTHLQIFERAEERHFFDYYAEGKRGRDFRCRPGCAIRADAASCMAFTEAIGRIYRQHDGSGRSCRVEVIERARDGSQQVTVYVEGLPSNTVELRAGVFERRISNPAIEMALVYVPATGQTTTVARGGAPVHTAILTEFQRHLLAVEPELTAVVREGFALDRLIRDPGLVAIPEHGVARVRVRKLRLAGPAGVGMLTVEAPGPESSLSVYDMWARWFSGGVETYRAFTVVHATIAMQFVRRPGAKRSRTINLELTRPNTSNIKSLTAKDREIAEAHIALWQLKETRAP